MSTEGERNENQPLTEAQAKAERDKVTAELWGEEGKASATPGAQNPPIDAEPEEEVPPKEEKPESQAEPEDPYAGLPPAVKEKLQRLDAAVAEKTAENATLTNRLKQVESRVGSITNQLHEAKKAAEETEKRNQEAPSQQEIAEAAKTDEEWEALKTEYPEWSAAMDKRFESVNKQLKVTQDLKKEVEAIKEASKSTDAAGALEAKLSDLTIKMEKKLISIVHPGWQDRIKTKEFQEWLPTQDESLRAKCSSFNSEDAIDVLDAFEAHRGNNGNQGKSGKSSVDILRERNRRLKESEVLSHGRVRKPAKREDDMTDAEYRQRAAQEIWAES